MQRIVLPGCLLAVLFSLAQAAEPELAITTGPILGRLSPHGIGVWARTKKPGTFRVRFGTAADKLDQLSGPAKTSIDHDNTGWVHITKLKANTKYWYDLADADGNKIHEGGSFRTLPDSADFKDAKLNPRGLFNFRFEFACGNNQDKFHGSGPALPAFKTMLDNLKDNVNFAILNGDWLYEDRREYKPAEWLKANGLTRKLEPPIVKLCPTIVGVWENYKIYLSRGKNLAAWHRNMPSFFTFDDHEILNDVWGAGTPGRRNRRAVFRDIGVRAWYDYLGWSNPTHFKQVAYFGRASLKKGSDILEDSEADFTKLDLAQAATLHVHWGTPDAGVNDNALDGVGGDPNAGVYGIVKIIDKTHLQITPAAKATGTPVFSIGRRNYYKLRVSNCDFFVCDTRSHRQMHDTKNPGKKGLSMLGLEQKKWLMDGMKKSDADILFVVSSVNFMVPHVGGGAVVANNKDDAWTVFLDEREQLIKFWDGLGKPVFVLTGDLHNSFAIKITERVWEFASGPHNSNNHIKGDEGDRPANGPYVSHGRKCDIRWSSYFLDDIPRDELRHPMYCVVQINNVFNSPLKAEGTRWVAFPRPQVIFSYFDGKTGALRYAETIQATGK